MDDPESATAVATPPPDNPSTLPSGTADMEARASANNPAATGAPGSTEDLEAKATAARTQPAPVSVVPAPPPRPKRGGIAGVVDDMADALAGTKGTPQVRQDAEGNLLIEHPALSRKGQWLKIAAEAFRGAAAGAAHMQGPGAAGRGLEAGAEAGEKMAEQQRQQQQQQSQEVRQANQDLFNSIKLKHDMAAKDFELSRMKVKATQDDIDFAQSQLDREKKLGSADLGVFKDEADLARVKDQNPNFWKDVYKNNVVAIPEVDEKGNRQGIHVFLRTPGIGSQLVEPGTPIRIWDAGKHEMTTQTPTVPMTHNMLDAYNAAADNQQKQWHIDQNEEDFKKQQTQTSEAEEEVHRATAGKTQEETKQLRQGAPGQADPFGVAPASGVDKKEFTKRYDAFGKNYVQPLTKTDQQLSQFAKIQSDIDKNGNMTGAESVVGLFNAIGISASPLKGMGFRINSNTVAEHEQARGLGQSLYQKFLKLKEGDIITPQQLKDYSSLATQARESQYFSAVDEARRQGLPVDFLPKGNGKVVDGSTARMYLRAAGGDKAKAYTALQQSGWAQ